MLKKALIVALVLLASLMGVMVSKAQPWEGDTSEGSRPESIAPTVRETLPEAVVTPYLVVAGTDARHYESISGNIYRFSPMALEGDDLARIHGTNERLSVESYGRMIRFFHRLIENAAFQPG